LTKQLEELGVETEDKPKKKTSKKKIGN
jgi:hypothetical protein